MNTELIAQHWDAIGDKTHELVETFYQRLFESHPRFRPLFPDAIDHQMEKMVEMLALAAKESDSPQVLNPHLARIGQRHKQYDLSRQDYEDFIAVLVGVMGEYNSKCWTPECEKAWGEVLEKIIMPHMVG